MLKLCTKFFEEICSIVAVIFILDFVALGAFFGHYVGEYLSINPVLCAVIFGIVGFILGFFFDVLTFGFIAQVIEIRKHLERLDK